MIEGQDQLSLLDNPVWSALSATHASFAEGDDLAKRYPVDVAPFAATLDQSPDLITHSPGCSVLKGQPQSL
jgi:hypothetical protein